MNAHAALGRAVQDQARTIDRLSGAQQVALLIAALLVVAGSAVAVERMLAPFLRVLEGSGKVGSTRKRVRFWERNGSGGRLSGAVRSGHRAWLDSPDVRKRAAAAVLPGGALSSHRGSQGLKSLSSTLSSTRKSQVKPPPLDHWPS